MNDQAHTLRRIMHDIRQEDIGAAAHTHHGRTLSQVKPSTPHIISITGGKGGIGKTLTTANLGLCFAQQGMRTLLIDGDFGLANLDVVLGVKVSGTIDEVLSGELNLAQIMVEGPMGVKLIPASSGALRISDVSHVHRAFLMEQVENLNERFDVAIVDTSAGVAKSVQSWVGISSDVVIVTTPEPTSLADGYATMKIVQQKTGQARFKLLVNMVKDEAEALRVYERISSLADEHLGVRVEYIGHILYDEAMKRSVRERVPCVQRYPFAESSACLRNIAKLLASEGIGNSQMGTAQFFWKRLLKAQENQALA